MHVNGGQNPNAMLGDESFREFRRDWCAILAHVCPGDDRGLCGCSVLARSESPHR